jgi:transcriptional regulator with XRE-family HTH domain
MKLKEWLKNHKLHLLEVSKLIGISKRTLQNAIYGKNVTINTAYRIEKFTNGEIKSNDILLPEIKNQIDLEISSLK